MVGAYSMKTSRNSPTEVLFLSNQNLVKIFTEFCLSFELSNQLLPDYLYFKTHRFLIEEDAPYYFH